MGCIREGVNVYLELSWKGVNAVMQINMPLATPLWGYRNRSIYSGVIYVNVQI